MRYATFSFPSDPVPRLGIVTGPRIVQFDEAVAGRWRGERPTTLLALIEQGPDAWQQAGAAAATSGVTGYDLSAVRLHAPIPRPLKNVFCVGRNYAAHVKEGAAAFKTEAKLPEVPVFF